MHRRRPAFPPLVPVLLLAAALLQACGAGGPRPSGVPGAPAAAAAVEQFLRLAQQRRYDEMGWLFGNDRGSVFRRLPAAEVEQRMYALATVLQHEAFAIGGETPLPRGRVRFTVTLRQNGRQVPVPFVAARGPEDRWYVEEVGLEAITNPGARGGYRRP